VKYFVEVGQDSSHCLDLAELASPLLTVTDICAGVETTVDFEIIGDCIFFEGLQPGVDTACLVFCDAISCDTTIIIVCVDTLDPPVAVDDAAGVMRKDSVEIDVLLNDTVRGSIVSVMVTQGPKHGLLTMMGYGQFLYVPIGTFCNGTDTFFYELRTTNGVSEAMVVIEVQCIEMVIYNAISPDGDSKNDYFEILGIEKCPHELTIFNRWGTLVYRTESYTNKWPDASEAAMLPDGTYFYVLKTKESPDSPEQVMTGYLQIHR
jgi:gliding motility-associated-like protein